MSEDRRCIFCGLPHERAQSPYCSRSCRDKANYRMRATEKSKIKKCPICRNNFTAKSTYCPPCRAAYDAVKPKLQMFHILTEVRELKAMVKDLQK